MTLTKHNKVQKRYEMCETWVKEMKSLTTGPISIENPSPIANPNMSVKLVSDDLEIIKYFPEALWLC